MWEVREYPTLVEIVPLNDSMEHYLGDECVCHPRIRQDYGYLPRIVHNSFDGRDALEEIDEY